MWNPHWRHHEDSTELPLLQRPLRTPGTYRSSCSNCAAVKRLDEGIYQIITRTALRTRNISVTAVKLPPAWDKGKTSDQTKLAVIPEHLQHDTLFWTLTARHDQQSQCTEATMHLQVSYRTDLQEPTGELMLTTLYDTWAYLKYARTEGTAYLLGRDDLDRQETHTTILVIFGQRPIEKGIFTLQAQMRLTPYGHINESRVSGNIPDRIAPRAKVRSTPF